MPEHIKPQQPETSSRPTAAEIFRILLSAGDALIGSNLKSYCCKPQIRRRINYLILPILLIACIWLICIYISVMQQLGYQ